MRLLPALVGLAISVAVPAYAQQKDTDDFVKSFHVSGFDPVWRFSNRGPLDMGVRGSYLVVIQDCTQDQGLAVFRPMPITVKQVTQRELSTRLIFARRRTSYQ